jgi:hypothetical protein
MIYLISCSDYRTVLRELPYDADAPSACRAEEARRDDGFAVVAERDGQIVADAEGWWRDRASEGPDPFDLACERRWD